MKPPKKSGRKIHRRQRRKRWLRAFGKVTAGICWGAALGLSGASYEAIVWFVVAAISLSAAAYIAFGRVSGFYRGEMGLPTLALLFIGLVFGMWLSDMSGGAYSFSELLEWTKWKSYDPEHLQFVESFAHALHEAGLRK